MGTFGPNFLQEYGASISGDMVAFEGAYGGQGIFVGNGGPLTMVIKTGDPLFGSTIRNLEFGRFGLDPSGSGNLTFWYRLANNRDGIAIAKPVASILGDYNGDGLVDTADYVVWRKNVGQPPGALPNDNTGVAIGDDQYNLWRSNFGNPATGSGGGLGTNGGPVPEPSSIALVMLGLAALASRNHDR